MPYIKATDRPYIDTYLNPLIDCLNVGDKSDIDGELNYAISRIVSEVLGPEIHENGRRREEWKYKDIGRAVLVFECAKLEFYRRVAVPKEDRAVDKNGDLPSYGG